LQQRGFGQVGTLGAAERKANAARRGHLLDIACVRLSAMHRAHYCKCAATVTAAIAATPPPRQQQRQQQELHRQLLRQ
jgi:hypothetical protein